MCDITSRRPGNTRAPKISPILPGSQHGSDGAVPPPLCDHRVGLHPCVVRVWYNPSGSAVVTCLYAAARTRRAARGVQGDVVSVWQGLQGTPSAPLIAAQRGAQCEAIGPATYS